ncbi:hypothetical protein MMC16_006705 [Acarospora aff. strigata]|nr:hypothetical protein [Acarospora aff. strigata]
MAEDMIEKELGLQSSGRRLLEGDKVSIPSMSKSSTKRNRHNCTTYVLVIAYIPLLLLYALLASKYVPLNRSEHAIDLNLFPSLAKSWPVQTESKIYKLKVVDSNFTGRPGPAIDQAWHDLLEGSSSITSTVMPKANTLSPGATFRVSKEDLDFYNITSIPLADGSGYATETFMTHELHCLKLVRKWKYKEFYYARELEHQGPALAELDRHVDHCIETLRQGIMCRSDVSLVTYSYIRGTRNVTARTWGHHQCVKYESLANWIKARAVDIFREGVLVPPDE